MNRCPNSTSFNTGPREEALAPSEQCYLLTKCCPSAADVDAKGKNEVVSLIENHFPLQKDIPQLEIWIIIFKLDVYPHYRKSEVYFFSVYRIVGQ